MVEQANQLLTDVEFTHRWYREYLQRLLAEGYEFRTFSDRPGDGDVFLRHDVDLSVGAAVRMARIESDLDVRSTYCFLLSSPLYNPFEGEHREAIREIESLGHEVALHFSTHEYWSADEPPEEGALERRVREERAVLDTIAPTIETVSFHRPPSWVLDREFDGIRSTYEPTYFGDIGYVADSSQRWRDEPPPIDDLPDALQLLTHPGLWAEEDGDFTQRIERAVTDACGHAGQSTYREFIHGGNN